MISPDISLLLGRTKTFDRTEKELRHVPIYFVIDMMMWLVRNSNFCLFHLSSIQYLFDFIVLNARWKYSHCQWDVHSWQVNKRKFKKAQAGSLLKYRLRGFFISIFENVIYMYIVFRVYLSEIKNIPQCPLMACEENEI